MKPNDPAPLGPALAGCHRSTGLGGEFLAAGQAGRERMK